MSYRSDLINLLHDDERRILDRLDTPHKVQDYLDALPINFADTQRSVRYTLKAQAAQCIEGALVACAAFVYHGQEPLILDLKTTQDDESHVVALFKVGSGWGAVSKTNHAVLRYRDPVYANMRELALSYFHEYYLDDGRKTLREFSRPFDLQRYEPRRWVASDKNLWWLSKAIDESSHENIFPDGVHARALRKASKIELDATDLIEWRKPQDQR